MINVCCKDTTQLRGIINSEQSLESRSCYDRLKQQDISFSQGVSFSSAVTSYAAASTATLEV
jgi:hypothetical protein